MRPHTKEGDPTALAAGDSFTLEIPEPRYSHCFASIVFYGDAACTTVAVPTAGALPWEVEVASMPGTWLPLTGQDLNLSVKNIPVNWTGSPLRVRVTGLSTVSGGSATHFRVRATCSFA